MTPAHITQSVVNLFRLIPAKDPTEAQAKAELQDLLTGALISLFSISESLAIIAYNSERVAGPRPVPPVGSSSP